MKIKQQGYLVPISNNLVSIIQWEILKDNFDTSDGVIMRFKDPNYSAEEGGFHPVEIALNREGEFQYITDFSFIGTPPYEELCKELDFDFSSAEFLQCEHRYPLKQSTEMYALWEENFINYYQQDVFNVFLGAFL